MRAWIVSSNVLKAIAIIWVRIVAAKNPVLNHRKRVAALRSRRLYADCEVRFSINSGIEEDARVALLCAKPTVVPVPFNVEIIWVARTQIHAKLCQVLLAVA